MTDKQVILAYRKDGADLDAACGPLRLVVPDEKRQARWVRQVAELEVVRVGAGEKPPPKPTQ
jgi:DMSO/TMAO reductase YedYZ molybdopterin-dependent catalytic subunit